MTDYVRKIAISTAEPIALQFDIYEVENFVEGKNLQLPIKFLQN
jgi:hypothetical protein